MIHRDDQGLAALDGVAAQYGMGDNVPLDVERDGRAVRFTLPFLESYDVVVLDLTIRGGKGGKGSKS